MIKCVHSLKKFQRIHNYQDSLIKLQTKMKEFGNVYNISILTYIHTVFKGITFKLFLSNTNKYLQTNNCEIYRLVFTLNLIYNNVYVCVCVCVCLW